jgi:hypothetical protein
MGHSTEVQPRSPIRSTRSRRAARRIVAALLFVLSAACHAGTPAVPTAATEAAFHLWLRKAPVDIWLQASMAPDFDQDAWLDEGRKFPDVVGLLVREANRQDLQNPSNDEGRIGNALASLGDKSPPVVAALVRLLDTESEVGQREAASALASQGNASVLPALRRKLAEPLAPGRLNACAAIGGLGIPDPAAIEQLRRIVRDEDLYAKECALTSLKKLGAGRGY